MNIDTILSDKFIEFSKQIAEIHEERKARTEEFKKLYNAFQSEIKILEAKAATLAKELDLFQSQSSDGE